MDSSEQLLWSVQVDHQLFALQKLDVTVGGCSFGLLTWVFSKYFTPTHVRLRAGGWQGGGGGVRLGRPDLHHRPQPHCRALPV